jgi:hypothetical protein
MKNIITISIRIFLVFTIFQFINGFSLSFGNFIGWNEYNLGISSDIETVELLKMYLPFICLWIVYLAIVILLWIKSEAISDKIIGKSEFDTINITLNYENALSICIIVIGIYLVIDSIPMLFSYISSFTVSKTRYVDKDFLKEYTIKEIIEIIGILLKMIIAFMVIKYNKKIIKKIIA